MAQESPNKHWKTRGYLDSYYAFDFSQPSGSRDYVTQLAQHNSFQINLAMLLVDLELERTRGRLYIQEGTYPQINYTGLDYTYRFFNQAYVGIKIGKETWIDVGVLPGHFGFESTMSIDNLLLSQAFVTDFTPYYQTGIQITYNVTNWVIFRGVCINGWQLITDNNKYKSVGFAFDYLISPNSKLSYGNYFGRDPVGLQELNRLHQNFVYNQKWKSWEYIFSLDALWSDPTGNYESWVWFTTAVISKTFNQWQAAFRYEYVQDKKEVLLKGPTIQWKSHIGTICFTRMINQSAKVRLEYRQFISDEKIWTYDNENRKINQVVALSLAIKS